MATFMRILRGLALGLVQGLTEYLPVSSSGHLVLLEHWGVAPPSVFVNLLLHLATLLAIAVGMRRPLWDWIRHPWSKQARWLYLVCLPTAAIALAVQLFLPQVLTGQYVAVGFLATSAVLLAAHTLTNRNRPLGVGNALLVGVVHGIAVVPGLSRSGATVFAMRALGIDKDRAVTLSFLMSVPVIVGGIILQLVQGVDWQSIDWVVVVSAFVAALLSGLFSLRIMLCYFNQCLPYFALYTFALCIVSLFTVVP